MVGLNKSDLPDRTFGKRPRDSNRILARKSERSFDTHHSFNCDDSALRGALLMGFFCKAILSQ
jgi:hypothetical protein